MPGKNHRSKFAKRKNSPPFDDQRLTLPPGNTSNAYRPNATQTAGQGPENSPETMQESSEPSGSSFTTDSPSFVAAMSDSKQNNTEQNGLAEPLMLEKIDSLFQCGVGELVDLPQIAVVGDQSSGKSSVLEGLINKPLPRDSGLCTRFATQIVFRRAAQEQIVVSIIPDRDASQEHITHLKRWGKTVAELDSQTFRDIMQDAHIEMGLAGDADDGQRKPTFSNDVLRLEIAGPQQEHLSVIDVPGIFKSTTEGVTTKQDIQMVRTLVKNYMDNPRSVMLAVVPANTDLATQEILELAAESDVPGDRTLGVLTKPDLVDKGAEAGVVHLVEGRARPMKLGWQIIRNPGQKELQDVTLDRSDLEAQLFRSNAPWNSIERDKIGIHSLRIRLKEVLSSLVKREFPKVKSEIQTRLADRKARLSKLGVERNSPGEQLVYLVDLAMNFQRLVNFGLNANHGADNIFDAANAMRIAPAVMSRMKLFADEMDENGQLFAFMTQSTEEANPDVSEDDRSFFEVRKEDDLPDIVDILHPQQSLLAPKVGQIKGWLSEVYCGNRGFELGTFNASILATTMRKQCVKSTDIRMGMISDVIVIVHKFIESALTHVCGDSNVRDALRNYFSDELMRRYQQAVSSTKFLLEVENSDRPVTLNHYFNENLQKSRQRKANDSLEAKAMSVSGYGKVVQLDHVKEQSHSMSNDEHVVQEIHDILQAYYTVSRKTFVDSVCKQSAMHYLLDSSKGPLALFSPVFVSQLSHTALEEIAGEAPNLKRARAQLSREIASLTAAVKILARG